MLVAGICVGAIYGLIAVGYTVVYTATSVFNLAQGDLVMVGIMGAYYLLAVVKMPQWEALPLVILFVLGLSLFEERTIVRPFLRRAGSFGWFISTLAFSLIIEAVVLLLYGHHPITAIPTPLSANSISLGPLSIVPRKAAVVVGLIIIVVALELFYHRSRWGKAMRAAAEDRQAASLRGINPDRVSRYAFALAGLVAGITGILIAPITYSDPTVGLSYTLKGFVALAIGGFGSIRGAIVGGLALGIAEQALDLYWNPGYEVLAGLFLLMIVLSIRPQGIFGARRVRMV
jgi:branched-chain amino acid transport system permease protein